jgi:copper chaperone NosL
MIRLIFIFILLVSCSQEPEPLRYGKDGCHACKMTLMDKKFGAELVTAKGKVYKFDDVNCMINFMNSDYLAGETLVHKLLVDYSNPGKLIPAEKAFYLLSDEIRSPMASGITSFETEKLMLEHKSKLKGTYLGWAAVKTQFK